MDPLTAAIPCPERIVVEGGAAFAVGAVGGSFFHFAKGLRNAPSGARFAGGLQAMRMNVPRVAGSFGVFGGLFSACDCALVYARQKEDPWNSILSGAATGGILSLRQGFRAACRSSMQTAILIALISGVGSRTTHAQRSAMSIPADVPDTFPFGGSFYGLFTKIKVEEGVTNRSSQTDTSETCKEPSMPVQSFEYK